jgi:hypothetical protein
VPVGRGLVQVPPPTPTPGDVPTRTVVTPPGTYRALWIPPDGSEPVDLNPPDDDWWSLKANSGLGAPPVDLITVDNPDGGVIVEGTRVKERTILWPIRMRSNNHLRLLDVWRETAYRITQTRDLGGGWLELQRPDGTRRRILAYYSSGLEGEPEDGTWLQVTAILNLLCPDPFWRDVQTVNLEFKDEPGADYLNPYPSFSSGRVLGAVNLPNVGHRAAWPSWRIRGPMTALTATNQTRGQSFTLTHTLAEGEFATISSRPIQVRGDADENLVGALGLAAGGGKPWRIDARTTSQVLFAVTGSAADSAPGADDGTRLWLSYPIDYETA